jgi:hypothetical protein
MRFSLLRTAPLVCACVALLGAAPLPAAAQAQTWAAGPGAGTDASDYSGSVDAPSNGATVPGSGSFQVTGWFVDKTAQGWAGADDVQVFLGQMGSGGTMLAKGIVAQNRPDVASTLGNPFWAASGFTAAVPGSSVPSGSQTLDVYIHTPGKGWWYEPVTVTGGGAGTGAPAPAPAPAGQTARAPAAAGAATGAPTVTINNPTENSNVSTRRGDYTIDGTATAGIGPSDIDRIDVYIDGEKDTGQQLGTTTPASDGSWSVTFTPTHFASTHSNIYVYAHSKSTGRETETVRGFNIIDT